MATRTVVASVDGFITQVNAEGYGLSGLILGAGRNTKEDVIDMTAGIRLFKKTGEAVREGEPIAILYTSRDEKLLEQAEKQLLISTTFGAERPAERPLIFDVII